jgi:hypothetical protein
VLAKIYRAAADESTSGRTFYEALVEAERD